jgi:hypothetical protein
MTDTTWLDEILDKLAWIANRNDGLITSDVEQAKALILTHVQELIAAAERKARDDENSTIHRWVQKPKDYDSLSTLEQAKWTIMTLGKIGSWLDARHAELQQEGQK